MIRLSSLIERIERHKAKASEFIDKDIDDDILFHALAMHCFQAVNAGIELGEFIVSEKKLGFPSKYKEIFELLYGKKLIGKKTLDDIKRLIFLLSRRYSYKNIG